MGRPGEGDDGGFVAQGGGQPEGRFGFSRGGLEARLGDGQRAVVGGAQGDAHGSRPGGGGAAQAGDQRALVGLRRQQHGGAALRQVHGDGRAQLAQTGHEVRRRAMVDAVGQPDDGGRLDLQLAQALKQGQAGRGQGQRLHGGGLLDGPAGVHGGEGQGRGARRGGGDDHRATGGPGQGVLQGGGNGRPVGGRREAVIDDDEQCPVTRHGGGVLRRGKAGPGDGEDEGGGQRQPEQHQPPRGARTLPAALGEAQQQPVGGEAHGVRGRRHGAQQPPDGGQGEKRPQRQRIGEADATQPARHGAAPGLVMRSCRASTAVCGGWSVRCSENVQPMRRARSFSRARRAASSRR